MRRKILLNGSPRRIISLVPSQTELLCFLGLEEKIAGVTKFCVHPSHIKNSKKVVGGTKQVHFDRIKGLQPDIILCNKEENTAEMVKELEKIAPVHVSNVVSFEDSLELISMYGDIFKKEQPSTELIADLQKKKEKFVQVASGLKKRVVYLIWREPWMAAGGDTFINNLLKMNGWENVCENYNSRYPTIELSHLKSIKPELVLLSSEPFPFREKHIEEIGNHYKGRVELVDGEFFSWYGSRLLPAFDYFRELQIKLSSSL